MVFWGHGAGGDKTSLAGNAAGYANDGYVTLTWTNRSTATDPSPETLAADIVEWVEHWNENPTPFIWHKTADEILNSLAKYLARISGAGH